MFSLLLLFQSSPAISASFVIEFFFLEIGLCRCLSFYEMAKRAKWPILPRKNASFGEYMTTLLESFQSCSGIIEKCGIKNFFRSDKMIPSFSLCVNFSVKPL